MRRRGKDSNASRLGKYRTPCFGQQSRWWLRVRQVCDRRLSGLGCFRWKKSTTERESEKDEPERSRHSEVPKKNKLLTNGVDTLVRHTLFNSMQCASQGKRSQVKENSELKRRMA